MATSPHAVEAIKSGAYDYILKPFDARFANAAMALPSRETMERARNTADLVRIVVSGTSGPDHRRLTAASDLVA
jgi:DNA-binding NtrC family response regulator